MIFADKLIRLRKKSGWSQEELAEQMHVTRQSISKWEGAQSVPDLEKVVRLSKLFGVSTDYLLKDEMEAEESETIAEDRGSQKRVSMEEANAFLAAKAGTAGPIACAVLLCILSPVCLMILGAMSEVPQYGLSENVAGGVGMILLLALVAVAVAIFLFCGSKTAKFSYLEKEPFETEYGVTGMVKEKREAYKNTYTRNNILGSCLCIASLIPLFAGVMINAESDLLMVCLLSVMLGMIGLGVTFFVRGGILWASFEKLLQEGEYAKGNKGKRNVVSIVYWPLATAIYLAYSFITGDWKRSWIIWVIAGVLYPCAVGISNLYRKKP